MKTIIRLTIILLFLYFPHICESGVNFDGVDDHIDITDDADFDLGSGNFTISAWIKGQEDNDNANMKNIVSQWATDGAGFTNAGSYAVYDTTDVTADSKGFYGSVFDGRYVYLVPYYNGWPMRGLITRYDTTASFTNANSYEVYDTVNVHADSRGFFGGVFDGRYIYLVPYFGAVATFGQITRYDTTLNFTDAGSYAVYDTTANVHANSRGLIGAIFDGKYIYFLPFQHDSASGQITRYDTTLSFTDAGSYAVYDTQAIHASSVGFLGGVFDGRYIYLVPFYYSGAQHGQITRYDTTASFTSAGSYAVYDTNDVSSDSQGFRGAVFDGRYVYFVPYHNELPGLFGQITRYDTTLSFTDPGSYSLYNTKSVHALSEGFFGAVFDGRYIYFIPELANDLPSGQVTRYDTTLSFTDAGSYAVYDTTNVHANSRDFSGGVFDGRYVYFVPYWHDDISGQITRYDTVGTNASFKLLYSAQEQGGSFTGSPYGVNFYLNIGAVCYNLSSNEGIAANTVAHIAVVRKGTELTMYIDDVSKDTITISGTVETSTSVVSIGSFNDGLYQYDGMAEEVAIWKRALSVQEISTLYNSKLKRMPLSMNTSNLIAYWPMDQHSIGTNINNLQMIDLSGNNNHGFGSDSNASGGQVIGIEILSYPSAVLMFQ